LTDPKTGETLTDPKTGDPLKEEIRTDISWKNYYYGDSLSIIYDEVLHQVVPSGISSIKKVFYQCTEYDAAMILHYIGGRLDSLPWMLDTVPIYGKLGVQREVANSIIANLVGKYSDNQYTIAVSLNGDFNGPISTRFNVNGASIVKIESNVSDNFTVDYENNTVVFAGANIFNKDVPVCYLTVQTDNPSLTFGDIRFNDEMQSDLSITSVGDGAANSFVACGPNPFNSELNIKLTVENISNYTVTVYDLFGNVVKNISTANLIWDGTDNYGKMVNTGVYFVRVSGEGNTSTTKVEFK
jgi:hypothetical protein